MAGTPPGLAGSAGTAAGRCCADASVSVIRGVGHTRCRSYQEQPLVSGPWVTAPSASALPGRGTALRPASKPHIRSKGTYAASGPDPGREIVQNQPNQSSRI